jgi:serine/threonine-protein kinase PknG
MNPDPEKPDPEKPDPETEAATAPTSEATAVTRLTRDTTRAQSRKGTKLSDGIAALPERAKLEATAALLSDPHVPEPQRFCSECNGKVGRARDDGRPARTDGFCPRCGHPFSFTPKLAPGDVVAGQYEVKGCIGHGGLGWVYLAQDHNVEDKWVVLKGLLNTGDQDARAAILAERRFLAEVNHPDIVTIFNFVEHQDSGYIVMEYVGGTSLRAVLDQRREGNNGVVDPLPIDQAVKCVYLALPALDYLHDLGLAYCDFKPENLMWVGKATKLIDLGGAYRMDSNSRSWYYTKGFAAPELDREHPLNASPSVLTDIYTVGRTLAVLSSGFPDYNRREFLYELPRAEDVPVFAAHDSLYRFLERATDPNAEERFQSVGEMRQQLLGVLREVVAEETHEPQPGDSSLFTGERRAASAVSSRPALPALLVPADDPAAPLLATISATATDEVLSILDESRVRSNEVELRRTSALVAGNRLGEAFGVLDRLEAEDPWEWRVDWYRGLAHLASEMPDAAYRDFEEVYRVVPGELAPKCAMALAAEVAGDMAMAARWAEVVARTDPRFTAAAMCLARCRLAIGDGGGAIAAYELVPETSGSYVDAQLMIVSVLLARAGGVDDPAVAIADVMHAANIVDALALAPERHARASCEIFETALAVVHRDGSGTDGDEDPPRLMGYALTDHDLRVAVESTYRSRAKFAASVRDRVAFVDAANRARPWTVV